MRRGKKIKVCVEFASRIIWVLNLVSSCNELNWRTSGIHVASNSDSLKNPTKATRAAFSQTFNILRAAGVIYRKCRMSSGMKHPRVKGQERCMIKKQEEKSPLNQMCYTLTWWTIFHADGGGVNTLRKWKLEVSRHQRGRGKNYRRPENRHSLPSDCCDQMFTCQSSVSVPNMTF